MGRIFLFNIAILVALFLQGCNRYLAYTFDAQASLPWNIGNYVDPSVIWVSKNNVMLCNPVAHTKKSYSYQEVTSILTNIHPLRQVVLVCGREQICAWMSDSILIFSDSIESTLINKVYVNTGKSKLYPRCGMYKEHADSTGVVGCIARKLVISVEGIRKKPYPYIQNEGGKMGLPIERISLDSIYIKSEVLDSILTVQSTCYIDCIIGGTEYAVVSVPIDLNCENSIDIRIIDEDDDSLYCGLTINGIYSVVVLGKKRRIL